MKMKQRLASRLACYSQLCFGETDAFASSCKDIPISLWSANDAKDQLSSHIA